MLTVLATVVALAAAPGAAQTTAPEARTRADATVAAAPVADPGDETTVTGEPGPPPPDTAATPEPEPGPIIDALVTAPEDWLWLRRPVVVFADSPNDPRYVQQMEFITDRLDALVDRDVIVITDTDPSARSPFRQALRPRGFMLAVLAKDGTIVTRKPSPWSVREISRSIDKLPLRQQEVRDRLSSGG
jgi:hypothetical protein